MCFNTYIKVSHTECKCTSQKPAHLTVTDIVGEDQTWDCNGNKTEKVMWFI